MKFAPARPTALKSIESNLPGMTNILSCPLCRRIFLAEIPNIRVHSHNLISEAAVLRFYLCAQLMGTDGIQALLRYIVMLLDYTFMAQKQPAEGDTALEDRHASRPVILSLSLTIVLVI